MASMQFSANFMVSHRAGSTRSGAIRQGFYAADESGSGDNARNTGQWGFDYGGINSALVGKVIDAIQMTMESTTWGVSDAYALHIYKSPFRANSANGSWLEPNDYYPAGDVYALPDYFVSPEIGRSQTVTFDLPADYLQHILDGYLLACYRRTTVNTPTTSIHTREFTTAPILTITYHDANTAPGAPPWASASPALFENGPISITWGAASDAESNVTGYRVQWALSDDGVNWSVWSNQGTYTGTSATDMPGIARGTYEKFQVCAIDAYGAESGYTQTNAIKRNSAPAAPSITAPTDWGTTYNSQPRLLVTVGSDADGHNQTLSAAGYEASSSGAQAAGKKLVLRRISAAPAGAQSVPVYSTDSLGAVSSAATRVLVHSVPAWTDPVLVAGETPIKAVHMTDLQTIINVARGYYGLPAYPFTTITSGVTGLSGWTSHVNELRAAIDEVVALVNGWDTANTTHDITLPAWIAITENRPTAAVIEQLRAAIPLL